MADRYIESLKKLQQLGNQKFNPQRPLKQKESSEQAAAKQEQQPAAIKPLPPVKPKQEEGGLWDGIKGFANKAYAAFGEASDAMQEAMPWDPLLDKLFPETAEWENNQRKERGKTLPEWVTKGSRLAGGTIGSIAGIGMTGNVVGAPLARLAAAKGIKPAIASLLGEAATGAAYEGAMAAREGDVKQIAKKAGEGALLFGVGGAIGNLAKKGAQKVLGGAAGHYAGNVSRGAAMGATFGYGQNLLEGEEADHENALENAIVFAALDVLLGGKAPKRAETEPIYALPPGREKPLVALSEPRKPNDFVVDESGFVAPGNVPFEAAKKIATETQTTARGLTGPSVAGLLPKPKADRTFFVDEQGGISTDSVRALPGSKIAGYLPLPKETPQRPFYAGSAGVAPERWAHLATKALPPGKDQLLVWYMESPEFKARVKRAAQKPAHIMNQMLWTIKPEVEKLAAGAKGEQMENIARQVAQKHGYDYDKVLAAASIPIDELEREIAKQIALRIRAGVEDLPSGILPPHLRPAPKEPAKTKAVVSARGPIEAEPQKALPRPTPQPEPAVMAKPEPVEAPKKETAKEAIAERPPKNAQSAPILVETPLADGEIATPAETPKITAVESEKPAFRITTQRGFKESKNGMEVLLDEFDGRIKVRGNTYANKEKLKKVGYKFNDGVWTKEIAKDSPDQIEERFIEELKLLNEIAPTDIVVGRPDRKNEGLMNFIKKLQLAGGKFYASIHEPYFWENPPKTGEYRLHEVPWQEFWGKLGAKDAPKNAQDSPNLGDSNAPKGNAPPPTEKGAKKAGFKPDGDTQFFMSNAAEEMPAWTKEDIEVNEPVRASDIVKFLKEKLDVPIRVGKDAHFKNKNILGLYKVKYAVIRTRKALDLSVIGHEVGHHLQKKLPLIRGIKSEELHELYKLATPVSSPVMDDHQIVAEGISEFVRLYLVNPAAAREHAPNYYKLFESKMDEYPEIKEILLTARKGIQLYQAQDPVSRVLSKIDIGRSKEKGSVVRLFDKLYSQLIDELSPLQKAVKEMLGDKYKSVNHEDDPYRLAWLSRGWAGKVETILKHGQFDLNTFEKIGPSYKEILAEVKDDLNNFRAYLVAKRALELHGRGINPGISKIDALETVKRLESDKFKNAAQKLYSLNNYLLHYAVNAGILSKEAAAKMKAQNAAYVPFYRVFEEEGQLKFTGKTMANLPQYFKRLKGSERDIIDPLESTVKNIYTIVNLAERNIPAKKLVELAGRTRGSGKWIEPLTDAKASRKENILTVFVDGKAQTYQVNPDLYNALMMLDKEQSSLIIDILSAPASTLRAGAILNPDFLGKNIVRDQVTAFIFSKHGYLPIWDAVRGLFHVIKRDDLYYRWKASGGAQSTLSSIDRNSMRDYLKNLVETEKTLIDTGVAVVKSPVTFLRFASEMIEEATRVGGFKKAVSKEMKSGAWTKEAYLRAALESRDMTLDFGRSGSKTKNINRVVAFFNAAVQGLDKAARAFKDNPVGTMVKTLVTVSLPSAYLYYKNKDDERYKELPDQVKDMYWIILTTNGAWAIPKPFELGLLFGTGVERTLRWLENEDPKAFEDFGRILFEVVTPDYLPTAFAPIVEAFANKSRLTGLPIVPQSELKLEPKEQYGPYTSETAKLIGEKTNISPRIIDNTIKGYFGGLGSLGADLADVGLKATGAAKTPIPKAKREWTEWVPVVRGFHRNVYGANSKSVTEFAKLLEEKEQRYNTLKRFKQRPSADDIEHLKDLKQLRQIDRKMDEIRAAIRQVQMDPRMDPATKRQKIDQLNFALIQLARLGLKKPLINKVEGD